MIQRGKDAKGAIKRNKGKLPAKMEKALKKSANKNISKGYKDLAKLRIQGVKEGTLRILTAPIRRPLAKRQFTQNKSVIDKLNKEITADDKKLVKAINQFNKKYDADTFFDPKRISGMDREAVKAEGLARKQALDVVTKAERAIVQKRNVLQALQQKQSALSKIITPPYQAAARDRIERGRLQRQAVKRNRGKLTRKQDRLFLRQGTRSIVGGYKDLTVARIKRVTQPTIKALTAPIKIATAPVTLPRMRKKINQLDSQMIKDAENSTSENKII